MKTVNQEENVSPSLRPPTAEELAGEVLAPAGPLAQLIGSTVPTVHAMARSRVIPTAVREGRVVRFRIPDVIRALEERAAREK